jgi:signal transduction histidine kinase
VIRLPAEIPSAVGYGPWVEEIWSNYITNALKYGGNPPKLEFGADELDNGYVRYWITDNGRGLTLEEQQRIFVPFTRLGKTAHVEGHGLGLSIVQRITERLGGEARVESEPDNGSKFSFTLPKSLPNES